MGAHLSRGVGEGDDEEVIGRHTACKERGYTSSDGLRLASARAGRHEERRVVFLLNETDSFDGQRSGAVAAFRLCPETLRLRLVNRVPSGGCTPCFVTLAADRRFLLVANYSYFDNRGSVSVVPVAADGTLSPPTCVVTHTEGRGPDGKWMQEGLPYVAAGAVAWFGALRTRRDARS